MANLLWTDIETTGLDPETCSIIQLGMIVTTPELVEIARFEEIVKPSTPASWEPYALQMHRKTGLYDKIFASDLSPLTTVEKSAVRFINEYAGDKPYMAGNSIHFDRSFLSLHMPKVVKTLHHRMLDVSFFKVLQDVWRLPEVCPSTETAHTALADLDNSIFRFKAWKKAAFKKKIGPTL